MLRKKRDRLNDSTAGSDTPYESDDGSNEDDLKSLFSISELQRMEQKFQEVLIELKQRLRGFHRSLSKVDLICAWITL